MAQPPSSQVIPQHVSSLLSHLTSRPGVQSTLILSRKDGSIIQSTGLLANPSPQSLGTSNTAGTDSAAISDNTVSGSTGAVPGSSDLTSNTPSSSHQDVPPTTTSTQNHNTAQSATTNDTSNSNSSSNNSQRPYKPSQAETLAAHIFAFMTSASGLALSLSGSTGSEEGGFESRSRNTNTAEESGSITVNGERTLDEMGVTAAASDKTFEREEDDEIKLVRLRTKKNEIVVVPDRKYLLCVVHDASGTAATTASGGGGGGISR